MEKLNRLSTDDRENLVAYLDGELDEQNTRRIESLLVQSSVARNDVELLSQTYELLDDLPSPDAPNDFVEKTLATAKMEGIKQPLSEAAWYKKTVRIGILAGWSAAIVLAALAGFAVTNLAMKRPEDVLLNDMQMIKNIDRYEEAESVEFLNQLTANPDLLEEMRKAASHE